MSGGEWPKYVPVARRRARAERQVARLRKQGQHIEPVRIEGRSIARTFWGRAWCEHLLKFPALASRLERGRQYLGHGAVCHLEVGHGHVQALVMGSALYTVGLSIEALEAAHWQRLRERCAGSVGSLLDLLQGRLSAAVMAEVTDVHEGLFPQPRQFAATCSCPDFTPICKHVAAVYYGIGARLDERPELLFVLRGVDHSELIGDQSAAVTTLASGRGTGASRRAADDDLAAVFGIDLDTDAAGPVRATSTPPAPGATAATATSAPAATSTRSTRLPEPLHADDIRALRDRLSVSRAELAALLGMSSAAVGLWERHRGPLRLQGASREALHRAWRLSRAAASRALSRG